MSFSRCWGCDGPLGDHVHYRDAWHPACREPDLHPELDAHIARELSRIVDEVAFPKPRVYVRKEATGWAFAVSDGLFRHATGTHIPTQQEALVAGLEALGWAESWEREFRLSAG